MKIAWTPYPFAGLSGTAKKPVSVPADNGGLAAAGTSRPPVRLDVAVLRCLRTVEEMTAQIMDMTGDGPPAVVDEYPGTTPAGVSGGSAIARGDILVFFPGPAPDGENEDNGAELVVVKGTGRAEYAAASETPREEALEGLAKAGGQARARLGRGVAPVVFDHGPPRPRERFIVSVDTVDGVTVPTVIHDAPSGVALVFNNGGGELSDGAIPDEVSAIVGLLSGAEEEVPMEELQSAWGAPSGTVRVPGSQEAEGPALEDEARTAASSLLLNPGAALRDMGRMVQRFFAVRDDQGEKTETEGTQDTVAAPSAAAAPTVTPPGGPSPVKVTFMGHPVPAAQVEPGGTPMAGEIAGKVAALSDAVNGIIAGSIPAGEREGDDAEKVETDEEGYAPMREAMRGAVAASFAAALKGLTGMDGREGVKPPGMSLDERGLLKVDAAVLRDALSGGKSETVRFVHDLTASLHDRIAYNPLAFAGFDTGRPGAALDAPSGNERAAGDDTERKMSFEKRLNEIRLLLKSSYELKDSFMQRKFAGEGG